MAIFQFTWKIDNFSMLYRESGNYLQSPTFTVDFLNETEWCLQLYPNGSTEQDREYMCLSLVRIDTDDVVSVTMVLRFVLESPNDINNILIEPHMQNIERSICFKLIPISSFSKTVFTPQDVLTIRFVCWKRIRKTMFEDYVKYNYNMYCCISRIKVSKRSTTWKIPKVWAYFGFKHKTFCHVDSAFEEAPSFKLAFFFSDDSKCKHAQIEIRQTNAVKGALFVKCKITVMSAHEEYQHSQEDSFLFNSNRNKIWHFPDFIAEKNLVDNKYIYLNETLYLSCDFTFTFVTDAPLDMEIPRYSHGTFKEPNTSQTGTSTLRDNISKLFCNEKLCDVKIVVDDRTLSAYKIVLCAQSPVFRAMFENDMKEKDTNVIEIKDIDAATVEKMLEFLHTDEIDDFLTTEEITGLYSAADKYQIPHLKQWCTSELLKSLSVGDIGKVLIFADRHQDLFMMSYIHDFMKTHATEIFHSDEWEAALKNNPALGNAMLKVLRNVSISY